MLSMQRVAKDGITLKGLRTKIWEHYEWMTWGHYGHWLFGIKNGRVMKKWLDCTLCGMVAENMAQHGIICHMCSLIFSSKIFYLWRTDDMLRISIGVTPYSCYYEYTQGISLVFFCSLLWLIFTKVSVLFYQKSRILTILWASIGDWLIFYPFKASKFPSISLLWHSFWCLCEHVVYSFKIN